MGTDNRTDNLALVLNGPGRRLLTIQGTEAHTVDAQEEHVNLHPRMFAHAPAFSGEGLTTRKGGQEFSNPTG
jgi:hypothetical protein